MAIKTSSTKTGILGTGVKRPIEKFIKKAEQKVIRRYKQGAPVNMRGLRRSVRTIERGEYAFVVAATADNHGFPYPVAVHSGTGIWRGSSSDFPSTGRIRAGTTNPGSGGIRPNMYAKRASEDLVNPLIQLFIKQLEVTR